MADQKITDLTDGGAIQATDEFVVARSGANNKIAGNRLVGVDGWVDDSADTWTYVSATSFKITGADRTALFTPGTRIKLTQTTVKYFVVASSTFSSDTTVTITGGSDYSLANAAISANFHSYMANPQGYPGWFAYSASPAGFGSLTTNTARFCVIGRVVVVQFAFTGTSNATTLTFSLPITSGASNFVQGQYRVENNGAFPLPPGLFVSPSGGTSVSCYLDNGGNAFTNSGTKSAVGALTYEI